jgi:hypothetical protein
MGLSGKKILNVIADTSKDPRKMLEALLQISGLLVGYFYIFVYQDVLNIKIKLISLEALVEIPIVAVVIIPLIKYIIVKPDALQRSPSKRKSIRFFQKEFPSNYLLNRCARCVETKKTCKNFVTEENFNHIRHWYKIFHEKMKKESHGSVEDTYWKGYTCKLLYYLQWILLTAFIASLPLAAVHAYFIVESRFIGEVNTIQFIYPLICGGMWILINILNKPDKNKPSGCWHAWREINRMHVGWLRDNEPVLVDLICKSNGNNKQFKESCHHTF